MSSVQLDDLHCDCDDKEGMGELNIRTGEYTCMRCGKVLERDKEIRDWLRERRSKN